MPLAWVFVFTDAGLPASRGLLELHGHILFYLFIMMLIAFWVLVRAMLLDGAETRSFHVNVLASFWGLLPSFMVFALLLTFTLKKVLTYLLPHHHQLILPLVV